MVQACQQLRLALEARQTIGVRSELRGQLRGQLSLEEAARSARAAAGESELREVLVDELDGHLCAVCTHVMVPARQSEDGRDHSPALLVPCGHNLCRSCVVEYFERQRKDTCPYCRGKCEAQVPNRPLEEIIVRLLQTGAGAGAGGSGASPASPEQRAPPAAAASGPCGAEYAARWVALNAQVRALELEREALRGRVADAEVRRGSAQRTVAAAAAECGRLAAARDALDGELQHLAAQLRALAVRREALGACFLAEWI